MAASASVSAPSPAYTGVSDLVEDGDVAVKVMVCRSWDVKNPAGKYIGTEYILSDDAGKAVHCVARSAIAHCVVSKLEVGGVFAIRRLSVSANKATYRLRRDDAHLINLESNTLIHKLDCSTEGFCSHPFMLTPFEDIAFNKNAFLIDVVGRPVNVGACKPTRNGSKLLDFELANKRGATVKVTLWGALCDDLTRIFRQQDAVAVVLLPAMNIREYRGDLHLSSTSGTIIYSEDNIPAIALFRNLLGDAPIQIQQNYGTLLGILTIGREQVGVNSAQTVTYVCKVKIVGIRPRTPWNYYSCGEKGCKKGVTPTGTQFWCASCEKICEFPVVRYLLRLEVLDDTTSLVVTLFDEVAESLVKKSAVSLLADMKGRDEEIEYPDEIQYLIGSVEDVEIKSHTYYNHGQYESFTVTRVLTPAKAETGANAQIAGYDSPTQGDAHVLAAAGNSASDVSKNGSAVTVTTQDLALRLGGSPPLEPPTTEPEDGYASDSNGTDKLKQLKSPHNSEAEDVTPRLDRKRKAASDEDDQV